MADAQPVLILAVGLAIVVGGIVLLRVNAFLSLLTAAMAVSLLAPGDAAEKIPRVAEAFGATVSGIGVVIALAALIGQAMRLSGAADRIVSATLATFGPKRSAAALSASSFLLAIPVFFDTVFYLLLPIARSLGRRTGGRYAKYLMATITCASAHALVPPTPGPLIMAGVLGVELGKMLLVGLAVALPAACAGLGYALWADRHLDLRVTPPKEGLGGESLTETRTPSPPLAEALAPVALPIALIATGTILDTVAPGDSALGRLFSVIGNPNAALLLSASIALASYWRLRRPPRRAFSHEVDLALMSGGMIILITAAGGAFGAMLKQAELAQAIESLAGPNSGSGHALLLVAFGVASLLKFAMGSTTAAMIVASGTMAAVVGDRPLGYDPVYLATAVGGGSLVGSWMNDSGFWIFSKMGGLSEVDTLRTWTPLLAIEGLAAMAMTLLLVWLWPMG